MTTVADILESTRGVKSDKRTRRLPYRPYNTHTPTQDQVHVNS